MAIPPYSANIDDYDALPDTVCAERVLAVKQAYGERLIILAHHYQRGLITKLADFIGDSFGLSAKAAAQEKADTIVFCGVRFMAESAAILGRDDQRVIHPEPDAGCPMADMAPIHEVYRAWADLQVRLTSKVIPITYMNSHAPLKAFVGKQDGIVCTSSNADKTFEWALSRGEKIFFFPDQHLGRNVAHKFGFNDSDMVLYRPNVPEGGVTQEDLTNAKVILWDGHCPVHMEFTANDIKRFRRQFSGCKIVVHPECTEEIVQAADAAGSTGFIVEYVKNANPGDIIFIGTEVNLVTRLAQEYPDRKVFRLHRSLCPTMYMINMANLAFAMEHLEVMPRVQLDVDTKRFAKQALDRMLEIK